MQRLTIDSSVIVAALRKSEEKHKECKAVLTKIINGEYEAIEPYSVLVEVVAAIKRRTGSSALAQKVKNELLLIDTITFEELVRFRAELAAEIALKNGLRGMDAIVLQTAKENNSVLVTLDGEMLNLTKNIVKTADVEKLS